MMRCGLKQSSGRGCVTGPATSGSLDRLYLVNTSVLPSKHRSGVNWRCLQGNNSTESGWVRV